MCGTEVQSYGNFVAFFLIEIMGLPSQIQNNEGCTASQANFCGKISWTSVLTL